MTKSRKLLAKWAGFTGYLSLLLLLTASEVALPQTGKKWVDMDYGPNMTHSFQVAAAPGRNISYKGVKVELDPSASMLFDEDLLRWSAGWTQCDLDWRNVIYDGSHGTHPSILGEPVFVNPVSPGWSTNGIFEDPRELPFGPLDKKMGRFQGLYRHGDRIVFKLNVGGSQILESSSMENGFLTRTVNLKENPAELYTQIMWNAEKKNQITEKDGVVFVTFGEIPMNENRSAPPKVEIDKGLIGNWYFSADGKQVKNGRPGMVAKNQGVKLTPGPLDKGLSFDGNSNVEIVGPVDLAERDFSVTGWVKTTRGGTIVAKGPREGKWEAKGKSLFVRGGKLVFDVGWVGAIESKKRVADGKWHAVGVTYESKTGLTSLYVDGKKEAAKELPSDDDKTHVFRLGYTATNFAAPLQGSLDDLRLFSRKLKDAELAALAGGVDVQPQLTVVAITGVLKSNVFIKDGNLRVKVPAKASGMKIQFCQGDRDAKAAFEKQSLANPELASLTAMTLGGPSNYPQTIQTSGKVASDSSAYVTDELTLPHDNPWKSWMRIGGFDFFSDPTKAALCTWSGDVWTVSGIKGNYEKLTWRRIATGMFQPLGLKIVDDRIFVGCRDQITELIDLNADGETDFYRTHNNDHQVTEHFHEFAMDLQVDQQGNFYYAKSARHALDSVVPHHGTLIRVSKDGLTSKIVCNGFRAANGVGIGPQGEMATSDQEGHWTPANRINIVTEGGFYGNMYSFHEGDRPTDYDPPLVWLPKNVDRSPAAQFWCNSQKWGPFNGKLLSTSYGTGKLWHVLHEDVDGLLQGGVVRFPVQFPTGVMRGRFHPQDGQLYTCGLFGWSSNQTQPGGFYRVRYTGKPVNLPVSMKTSAEGIALTFSDPLEKESAEDYDNYSIEQWNYRWTKNYGSAHYSVRDPKRKGQDEVEVLETTLSDDGRTVFIEIEDIQPVMQMQISYTLKAKSGDNLKNSIWLTINRLAD
ncbi:MAG: hypothetical protein P8M80_04120 [Pirellulaceae bacterium]|nr:hypothetical protein [Pirellulaceae bacterium]